MLACILVVLLTLPAAAAEAPPTIRVLVQNVYGRREKDCEQRYKALAEAILTASPPYDIVALNEHWRVPIDRWYSCDADVLSRAMEKDGRYKGAFRSIRHLPRSGGLFEVSGGNSVFTLHKIIDSREERFPNSRDIPLSGYALARVELAPGVELDLWNVHLEARVDDCDDSCRRAQAGRLGRAIAKHSGPSDSRAGNAILLVGDFNTGGPISSSEKPPFAGNGGYSDLVAQDLKGARDLWLEGGKDAGFTYDCAINTVQKCKSSERIDYMFLPEHADMLDPKSAFVLVPRSVEVARFKTPSGGFVSDHFGLDALLELRRRPSPSMIGETEHALLDFSELNWDSR